LGDNPWIDFNAEPCKILESPKTSVSYVSNVVLNNVHDVTTNVSAMQTTSFIFVSELLGEEFEKQALGVLEKTEAGLNKFGMDKHNIVSIMLSMVSLS
jgi:enamine deaminase RidA (YjgF/YER057c/UK114 family)